MGTSARMGHAGPRWPRANQRPRRAFPVPEVRPLEARRVLMGFPPTITTLAVEPPSAVVGRAVTLTATVTIPDYGVPASNGFVDFYDGPTKLGSAGFSPTGIARLVTTALGPGVHAIQANHAGMAEFKYSSSADTPARTITPYAGLGGTGFQGDGGPAIAARVHTPSGLAVDAAGDLFIADAGNHVVRRVSPDGIITAGRPVVEIGRAHV